MTPFVCIWQRIKSTLFGHLRVYLGLLEYLVVAWDDLQFVFGWALNLAPSSMYLVSIDAFGGNLG